MQLSKEQTAAFLQAQGYEVDRNFKFRLRQEHTASASINPKDGKIKDFGSGWQGDVIDLLVDFKGFQKAAAFYEVQKFLGRRDIGFIPDSVRNIAENNLQQSFFDAQKILINALDERGKNQNRFCKLLDRTLPSLHSQAARQKFAEKFQIGYSAKMDRLIMPVRDDNGEIQTFWKYNPDGTSFTNKQGEKVKLGKVLFDKNRPRIPFNAHNLGNYASQNEVIFICEGEKDCLNMLAQGFNAIGSTGAGTPLDAKHLSYLSGKYVTIAYDFDDSGIGGAARLKEQLQGIAEYVEILDWQKMAKQSGIALKKGYDVTDFLSDNGKRIEKKKEIEI